MLVHFICHIVLLVSLSQSLRHPYPVNGTASSKLRPLPTTRRPRVIPALTPTTKEFLISTSKPVASTSLAPLLEDDDLSSRGGNQISAGSFKVSN